MVMLIYKSGKKWGKWGKNSFPHFFTLSISTFLSINPLQPFRNSFFHFCRLDRPLSKGKQAPQLKFEGPN